MKLTLEIHPAEGGDDAKMLVKTQAGIYRSYAARNGITVRQEVRGYL